MILNAHSYYSLRYGLAKIKALVDYQIIKGYDKIVLTDINNSSGCLEYVKACFERNITPVVGIEFRDGDRLLYIGIARNQKGFKELNDFLTDYKFEKKPLPEFAPEFKEAYIIYPFGKKDYHQLNDNEFIGIRKRDRGKIVLQPKKYFSKYVVLQSMTHNRKAYEIHKYLRAIDHNCLITELTEDQYAHEDDYFPHKTELIEWYKAFPEIIQTTQAMLDTCSFEFDFKSIKNKRFFTSSKEEDMRLITRIAYEGVKFRYGDNNQVAKDMVAYELELINDLDFAYYYLITWDMTQYSTSKGIHHVGRGSGANSIISYCLQITNVCPITYDLSLERFINRKRKTPPDFDIDYSWNERDIVVEYLFHKYGRKHVAWVGTMNTFKNKSPVRELGKVFGLPKKEIDYLVAHPDKFYETDTASANLRYFKNMVSDFPNLRSVHAGGILISEEEITNYVALDLPPIGFPTTQFDMYTAEEINLLKLDVLSQRGIGHIYDGKKLIKQNRGIDVDIHDLDRFTKDEKIKDLIRTGRTIGAFYMESPYMIGLFNKLKCDSFEHCIAASSIIRPGVSKSGMMREYIKRFNNPGSFEYLHPVMEQTLKGTFGVMIYQEDVLRVANVYAEMDMEECDELRRMMSGKTRGNSRLAELKTKFFSGAEKAGRPLDVTEKIWEMIESFTGYSFSKAHSASYVVQSYESLFLKAYYPLEHMVAVLNNQGGFYGNKPDFYVEEARRWGGIVELACVNHSEYLNTIKGNVIHLGFMYTKSLRSELVNKIIDSRSSKGKYRTLEDFVERVNVGLEQLLLLIKIGAMRFTGKSKKELYWDAHSYFRKKDKSKKYGNYNEPLFDQKSDLKPLPKLEDMWVEDAYDEINLMGFPVTKTKFNLLRSDFRGSTAKDLKGLEGKTVKIVGSLVDSKKILTVKGEYMFVANFLDSENNSFDTVHFPKSLDKYPMAGYGIYLIEGKVGLEFGHPSIDVTKFARMPIKDDPRLAA